MNPKQLASYIDHTLLKPEATYNQIRQLCEEAKRYGFYSVCVNPVWVRDCSDILKGTNVNICSVIGFPLGTSIPVVKGVEAIYAAECGADEIDMVISIRSLKSNEHRLAGLDIETVRIAVPNTTLKVIIEACLLTDEEKIIACRIAKSSGADFVKTSTGFSTGGATVKDVVLMRKAVGPDMGVKAAGGIRDLETAHAMIEAGATRLGCSASVKIIQELGKN